MHFLYAYNMEQAMPFWKHAAIFILELVFVVNVMVLDIALFSQLSKQSPQAANTTFQQTKRQETTTLVNTLPITPTTIPSPTQTQQSQIYQQPQPATNAVKEYYVPLGSGQSNSQTYENIIGAQAYINSASYANIKTVIFEAAVYIPTGNETAWIQLYDVTQNHPVWNSEMSWNGGSAQYLTSSPITLDSGNNLYQVQIKTQLPAYAQVNQSKIHIILH